MSRPPHLHHYCVHCSSIFPLAAAPSWYSTFVVGAGLTLLVDQYGLLCGLGRALDAAKSVAGLRRSKSDRLCVSVARIPVTSISPGHTRIPCLLLPNALTMSCVCDTSPRLVAPHRRWWNQDQWMALVAWLLIASIAAPGYVGFVLDCSCPSQPARTI